MFKTVITCSTEIWNIDGCEKEVSVFPYKFHKELLGVSKSIPGCVDDLELGITSIQALIKQKTVSYYFRVASSS